jgi:predicted  nucleic acid-binding Zn-ribbon protein
MNLRHEPFRKEKTVDLLLPMLLSLQQLDDKLSAFSQKKRQIPERIQAMTQAFEDEKKQLEDDRQQLKEAFLRQRNLEKQLQESAEERKKKKNKLLEVKTNAEYKAMLKEIDYAKQADSATEDDILVVLEEIEGLEQVIRKKEKAIRESESKLKEETLRLEREGVEVDKEHQILQGERKKVAAELDPAVLGDYEKIRLKRAGQAVVTVKKEVCPGCHMQVPPQTINEVLQTGEIRHCQYCRRILYCELEETA